eukprot:2742460-Amphidinium_carterae.1
MEGMTAAAEGTKARTLAELLGPNVTEAGEKIASTMKGSPFLVNATNEDACDIFDFYFRRPIVSLLTVGFFVYVCHFCASAENMQSASQ